MRPKQTLSERFFSKVEKRRSGCWEWTSGLFKTGYGGLWVDGEMKTAHRVSWQIHNGAIQNGLHVCHKCDNRKCVNPQHLFLGTNLDNTTDKTAKGRAAFKLTTEDVVRIRSSQDSPKHLAAQFGVSRTMIYFILNRQSWRHVAATAPRE